MHRTLVMGVRVMPGRMSGRRQRKGPIDATPCMSRLTEGRDIPFCRSLSATAPELIVMMAQT